MAWKKQENTIAGENYIFTDSYRTKDYIWESYYGFKENYNEYRHYIKKGVKHKVSLSGMERYGFDLYIQVRGFCEKFLSEEEITRMDSLMKNIDNKELSSQDWFFVRLFFENFMTKSGIKDIMKEKPDTGNIFMQE